MVLVVEDDKLIQNLMSTTLDIHNYRYLTASTASDALMQITSHNPDVIFLDLGLPDMDGVDLIRKIRTWSVTPIIVISARSEDSDKIEALDAGADDYLTKPFSVDELLARLRVTISDNGPGIPDTEKPYVFAMFYSGSKKVTDSKRSLGLGLALCRSIIRAHGCEITLSDNVPAGCCFSFTLPMKEVAVHE
jgi:DNA-binding response OmpR family regulator